MDSNYSFGTTEQVLLLDLTAPQTAAEQSHTISRLHVVLGPELARIAVQLYNALEEHLLNFRLSHERLGPVLEATFRADWGMLGVEDSRVRSRYERSMKWKMAKYHQNNITRTISPEQHQVH
jgi:hypothetical protein